MRHQLPYEAGEGGQQGGAGGGGEETLQIGFYMDPTQKKEHLHSGPYQVYLSAQLQELHHRRVQVAVRQSQR